MSAEEGRLSRWARRKNLDRAGAPEPEPQLSPKRGSAAPVVTRKFVLPMAPLALPEEGETAYEAAPPDALALLDVAGDDAVLAEEAALKAFPIRPEDEGYEPAEEEVELTPEQKVAVHDLPPIESLKKDSDFTPFFGPNVPDFLKRQAFKVLWMSSPFFGFRDGLDDYDENYRIIDRLISAADSDYQPGKGYVDKDAEEAEDEEDDIGEGEGEDEVAEAAEATDGGEKDADSDDEKRKEPRKSDVRPPR
ncbi:MAG: DUF3306 domain-containing protein [Rhodospirillales bacterium]|nr:DUF3306 domain-containing protein [Rhodospirillales bacterium]